MPALLMGNCAGVPPLIASIVNQMSIPLIQGSIRYAEICARTGDRALSNPEKAQAERTAFAAARDDQRAATWQHDHHNHHLLRVGHHDCVANGREPRDAATTSDGGGG